MGIFYMMLHIFYSLYGTCLCFAILYDIAHEKRLFTRTFKNRITGEISRPTFSIIFNILRQEAGSRTFLGLAFSGIFLAVPIGCYWLWHMYILGRGKTSNERKKWMDLEEELVRDLKKGSC